MSAVSRLIIEDLHASVGDIEILRGIDLNISSGEVHAIMGRNGSGKSTLANVLMGHPGYTVTSGRILLDGKNLLEKEVHERARAGVFLSFQHPVSVPGVQVGNLLKRSMTALRGKVVPAPEFRKEVREAMEILDMDRSFLSRTVNDGFSGGERKRMEILQLILAKPRLAILDEADSGLDIDALRAVATGIKSISSEAATLAITHYRRILDHLQPDCVHVLMDGRIVESGDAELVDRLENEGYEWINENL